jgi:ABC-2 type transport system permease protein
MRAPAGIWFPAWAASAEVTRGPGALAHRRPKAWPGPALVVLMVAFFASFFMITQPASAAAKAISYFPLTAPFAMPGRIAMGATAWWEPVLAIMITLASITGLVQLAGRLYTNALLHSGPTLSLKDAWRSTTKADPGPARAHAPKTLRHRARALAGRRTKMTQTDLTRHRLLMTVLTGIAVALGVTVAMLTSDVIIGVIAGAGFFAVAVQMVKLWTGHSGPPVAHH